MALKHQDPIPPEYRPLNLGTNTSMPKLGGSENPGPPSGPVPLGLRSLEASTRSSYTMTNTSKTNWTLWYGRLVGRGMSFEKPKRSIWPIRASNCQGWEGGTTPYSHFGHMK